MSRQISRLSVAVLVLFGALFVNLNLITLVQSDELASHSANRRLIIQEYAIERGPIVVGERAIARNVESDDDTLRFRRSYPDGELYAHLTGYHSILLQRAGLERALNEDLTGRPTELIAQNLTQLIGGTDRPGNAVELTVDPEVQAAARRALDGRQGAVVALDPSSGAVLAAYANPTYDPNPLSSHDIPEITEAWERYESDPDRPLLDRTIAETYPPGSTFKLLVTAAALEGGLEPSESFPDEGVYDVPQTDADIGNFGGGVCTDGDEISLSEALVVSCNTVFARLGVELGAEALLEQSERFGFNQAIPYELSVADSVFPDELDEPATAQSAIGQRDVRATPMQMALVAASIANDGQLLRPHVVASVHDPDGQVIRGPADGTWDSPPGDGRPVSPRTAGQLREMMVEVVRSGTGRAAAIDGVEVGGKTGTAQVTDGSTVWFAGFAGDEVAVAVVLPDLGTDATGGGVAAPVARAVMQAALGDGG
ncbi:MAG: peptidoglycan D,D-transpeptidase FtsI family protein [Nitriliruptoraceae bacterium]